MYIVNLAEQGQNVSRIFYCVIMFKKTLMDTENTKGTTMELVSICSM